MYLSISQYLKMSFGITFIFLFLETWTVFIVSKFLKNKKNVWHGQLFLKDRYGDVGGGDGGSNRCSGGIANVGGRRRWLYGRGCDSNGGGEGIGHVVKAARMSTMKWWR